ncbi:MAG: septum formation initiator family protein [Microthrixaceae bacterium]|nr:septum formation initiator family protein [Microthrixaceae bacterium]
MIDAWRRRFDAVPRWVRRAGGLLVLATLAVVILAAPVRDWWAQRGEIRDAEANLAMIEADNRELRDRLDRIGEPATIEQIARRDLGLVRVGGGVLHHPAATYGWPRDARHLAVQPGGGVDGRRSLRAVPDSATEQQGATAAPRRRRHRCAFQLQL